jgi:hypothetical protein
MTVVAKFYCEGVKKHDTGGSQILMRPDFPKDDNPDHPNKTFWDATPSGSLSMFITNQAAVDVFEAGAVYTLTFERD